MVPSALTTGVLKIPLPVGKVHRLPPVVEGLTEVRPSCRAFALNFGQGLSGASGTLAVLAGAALASSLLHEGSAESRAKGATRAARAREALKRRCFTGVLHRGRDQRTPKYRKVGGGFETMRRPG